MSNTEVYFEGQRAVISKHIDQASKFIMVAMAWFTDKSLFEQLIRRANEGVQVQVLLHDDDINATAGIDYGRLNGKNSELYLIADCKKTMHHKFCVIDCYTVLHGSYNWTYQAMSNHENLTVTQGDISLAANFITQFFKLKKSYAEKAAPEKTSDEETEQPKVSRRAARRRERGTIGDNSELIAKIKAKMEEDKKRAAIQGGTGSTNEVKPPDTPTSL